MPLSIRAGKAIFGVTSSGPGAGSRNSIGIVLVSGMIIGTLFTLFVLPAIYMLVARNRNPGQRDTQTEKLFEELELETLTA